MLTGFVIELRSLRVVCTRLTKHSSTILYQHDRRKLKLYLGLWNGSLNVSWNGVVVPTVSIHQDPFVSFSVLYPLFLYRIDRSRNFLFHRLSLCVRVRYVGKVTVISLPHPCRKEKMWVSEGRRRSRDRGRQI